MLISISIFLAALFTLLAIVNVRDDYLEAATGSFLIAFALIVFVILKLKFPSLFYG